MSSYLNEYEDLKKEIENTASGIRLNKEKEIKLTMTFGVVENHAGDNVEASISRADAALYMGKRNGRNQVIEAGAI